MKYMKLALVAFLSNVTPILLSGCGEADVKIEINSPSGDASNPGSSVKVDVSIEGEAGQP